MTLTGTKTHEEAEEQTVESMFASRYVQAGLPKYAYPCLCLFSSTKFTIQRAYHCRSYPRRESNTL